MANERGTYDVIIMGGGPAGATLGAILARSTRLSVALYERDTFPREHIGESLVPRSILQLQQSGALAKVLASDCYVKKSGGFFDWEPGADPHTLFFAHDAWKRDGFRRWSLHVNRAEFDQILLDHARDSGVRVLQGTGVAAVEPGPERTLVRLEDGTEHHCRIFVDASGRQSSVLGVPRAFLSSYKNIAVWGHFTGGKRVQTLPGAWNIYRDDANLSPIGNFLCEDGWFWYIPVRRQVNGERITTHSIGLVTDPAVLKEPGKRYTELGVFLARCRRVPRLAELVADVEPVSGELSTATNYSMISDRLCSYDERWILAGDVAFFVDPLFSSGATLAASMASSAAFMITATLESSLSDVAKRDLWTDYHTRYRSTAETLAAMIDQWYHAIGRLHPGSTYTRLRALWPLTDARGASFTTLLNLSVLDAFLDFSLPPGQKQRWTQVFPADGPPAPPPSPTASVRLREGVAVRAGAVLGAISGEVASAYWADPVMNGPRSLPTAPFHACHRFHAPEETGAATVPFLDAYDRGLALHALLSGGPQTYGPLQAALSAGQQRLLQRLIEAGLVVLEGG